MLLIPAIDLKDGCCVRLKQGDINRVTVFSKDPAEMTHHWLIQGAKRLHIVDLNGALAGKPKNSIAIKSIINAVKKFATDQNLTQIPIQLGGGIRDLKTIDYYLNHGLHQVIIGTAGIQDVNFLKNACYTFPGQIIGGLDAKNEAVATNGWSNISPHNILDLARQFEDCGCQEIIYTDIIRDGMLEGVNINATVSVAKTVSIPIIASGGVKNILDIEKLCQVQKEGIKAVICGRSIYEGTLDFKSAQTHANTLTLMLTKQSNNT